MPVTVQRPTEALWSSHLSFTGGQTAQTIRSPSTGAKTLYVKRIIITVDAGATAGTITVYDNSDSGSTRLYKGKPSAGTPFVIEYSEPRPLAAAGNTLYYTTGASVTGEILAEGYEK